MLFLETGASTPQLIVFVAIACVMLGAWVFGAYNAFRFLRASHRWRKELGYPEALRCRIATTFEQSRPAMDLYRAVLGPAAKGGVGLTPTEREMRRHAARFFASGLAFMALGLSSFAIRLI